MSQFLGRQDCIESLRRDLVDLQGATLDVFSRTGPVRFSSWKFPDKLSCNLDMAALLEQYDFVDGEEEFNQHSHIVLLELVIDRLLLLLQSFNAYVVQVRCSHKREETQHRGCLSVGLVVRTCWSNLIQFAEIKGTYKDAQKQAKAKLMDCDETDSVSSVSHQMTPRIACLSSTSTTPCFPKVNCHNVSCQTVESSLVPCDACHQVQCILRKTGDTLIELFQSEGLPSSLQPLLTAVVDTQELGQMTAGDVAQWANEQFRDMRRLAKHLEDVRATVQPLKARLVQVETERERFRSQLEQAQNGFKQKLEKHQASIVQLEFSLHKAQRSVKETEQRLQEENKQRKIETLCLEENNSKLKEKMAVEQAKLQALEFEKKALQEKVRTLHKEEEASAKLQQRIQQLEGQISETQLCLEKEKAKYHSAYRQQESMQAKQQSLLKRVDDLDQECEELQGQLGEQEERRIELCNQLQLMSDEKEKLQVQLTKQQDLCLELQQKKQTLETNIGGLQNSVAELQEYVQALKKRERLLVAFPELSPLAQAPPQSTGNVLLDMEQQLQANSVRINILEQENVALHSSLVKLRERAYNTASREASPQKQTRSLSLLSIQNQEEGDDPLTKMPLQSGNSGTRPEYSNSEKEAGREESDRQSAGSERRVSTTLQLHLQTLPPKTGFTAVKSHMKPHSPVVSHFKSLRKK